MPVQVRPPALFFIKNPYFQLGAEVDSFFAQNSYNRIGRRNLLVKIHMRIDVSFLPKCADKDL